jgi:hypothetical protein
MESFHEHGVNNFSIKGYKYLAELSGNSLYKYNSIPSNELIYIEY